MREGMRAGFRALEGLSLNVFSDDEIEEIHLATLRVLWETGIRVLPENSKERKWLAQLGLDMVYEEPYTIDDEKARFAFVSQCFVSIMDTLGLCQFVWGSSWQLYGPSDIVELCKTGIGWDTSLFELMLVGERRINMMRFFNAREGFSAKDDYLPDRMYEALPDGPSGGRSVDRDKFSRALEAYYQFAGWDPDTGNPTDATLRRLSLGWLLDK